MKSHRSDLLPKYAGSDAEQAFVDAATDFAADHILAQRSDVVYKNPYVYKYDFARNDSLCGYIKMKLLPAMKGDIVWDNYAKRALEKILGNSRIAKSLSEQREGDGGELHYDSEVKKALDALAAEAYEAEEGEKDLREYIETRPKHYIPYIEKVNNLDWDKIIKEPRYHRYRPEERIINEHKIISYHLMFILADLDDNRNPHTRENAITRKFSALLLEPEDSPLGRKPLGFWKQKANGLMQSKLRTNADLMVLLGNRLEYRCDGEMPLVEETQNIRDSHLQWIYGTMAKRLNEDYKEMKHALLSDFLEGEVRL
jgi:hypothetical protein